MIASMTGTGARCADAPGDPVEQEEATPGIVPAGWSISSAGALLVFTAIADDGQRRFRMRTMPRSSRTAAVPSVQIVQVTPESGRGGGLACPCPMR